MNTRLLLIIVFCIVGVSAHSQSNFAIEFGPVWQRAKTYTIKMAEAMPEKFYQYKPTKDAKTFEEELTHITNNIGFLQYYVTGVKANFLDGFKKTGKSKSETLSMLNKAFDAITQQIEKLQDKEAKHSVKFFAKNVAMTKKGIYYLIRDHLTHHRAQLVVYLRLKGIKPPRYVGW
ncbi:DinB family protein [Microscilla marina]|uniref:DinB family protein n=1 Tax=Microscilla marina ATCC 23134 TaxID=313606 RepID=A1ZJT1_MICM2|nr:DinB family protein [Microscilla marina]EAY29384.1 hypothetical protein M23134_01440 [Microscilla marina ATCC 23134]